MDTGKLKLFSQASPGKETDMIMPIIESFHSSLKSEGFNTKRKASISNSKVVQIVNQYMHYYNQVRIQAKLNYLSPIEFGIQVA